MEREKRDYIVSVVCLVAILIMLLVFPSCKTIKEVPVECVKYRTEYIDRINTDSIYQHDSIYIKEAGDTIEIYRDKYIYKYKYVHDTFLIRQIDTIPKVVEVQKPLSRYEEVQMKAGKIGLSLLVILIAVGLTHLSTKNFK